VTRDLLSSRTGFGYPAQSAECGLERLESGINHHVQPRFARELPPNDRLPFGIFGSGLISALYLYRYSSPETVGA
jgi:hypothetical protein